MYVDSIKLYFFLKKMENIEKLHKIRNFFFLFQANPNIFQFLKIYSIKKNLVLIDPKLVIHVIKNPKIHEALIRTNSLPTANLMEYYDLINILTNICEPIKYFTKQQLSKVGDAFLLVLPIIKELFEAIKEHLPEDFDEQIFMFSCHVIKRYLLLNTGINPTSATYNVIIGMSYAIFSTFYEKLKEKDEEETEEIMESPTEEFLVEEPEKKKKRKHSRKKVIECNCEKEKYEKLTKDLIKKEESLKEREKILEEKEKKSREKESSFIDKKEKFMQKEKEFETFKDKMRHKEENHWKKSDEQHEKFMKQNEEKKKNKIDILLN